jgi:hypothetical protein
MASKETISRENVLPTKKKSPLTPATATTSPKHPQAIKMNT